MWFSFFFNDTATTEIYTLSLHDALPIFQITLKQMLRDFIGIRVNRAKKSGMVNITSSVNSRERSGINTILHELNPLLTLLAILTMPLFLARLRSEERFSRHAETELVCRLLL